MQKIITPDGSVTFHNEQFDEAYHSKSGAKEEAVEKFVKPCLIQEIAKTGRLRILDVCFGLSYNTVAAIDAALEENPNCKIEAVGLEIDEEILKAITEIDAPFTNFFMMQEAVKNKENSCYKYENKNVKIEILLGDATKTIKTITKEFDVVFLDPFSPKKCPQLWTAEFFAEIYKRMAKNSRLATYSCARVVRDNLKAVGFTVIDGPQLWRRGPSTIGIKE
jgi:tRNA U34 5-methylaminomethyl-2-thiouridine-forming methyltransferase MnmC